MDINHPDTACKRRRPLDYFSQRTVQGGIVIVIAFVLLKGALLVQVLQRNIGQIYFNRVFAGQASWSLKVEDQLALRAAEEWLGKAVDLEEGDPLAWRMLGFLLAAEGEEAEAVSAWRMARLMGWDFITRGQRAWKAREYESALKWYGWSVQLDPDSADGWYHLGIAFQQEGRWEQALDALSRAIELKPRLAGAYIAQADVLALGYGDHESARTKAEQGLRIAPRDTKVLYEAAEFFQAIRDYERAEELYRIILSLEPRNLYAWIGMGRSLFAQERFREALEAFEQGRSIKTGTWQDAIGHTWLGRTYLRLGRPHEALDEFKLAVQIHPTDSDNFVRLGDAYQMLGEEKQALRAYHQALAINPANEWVAERISGLRAGE